MCTTERRQRGFTPIELIIFIVIVGIGVTGILSVYTNTIRNSADPMVRKRGHGHCRIADGGNHREGVRKPYGWLHGSPGRCGTTWMTANGYTSATVVDLQGSTVAGLAGYRIGPTLSVATTTLGAATVKKSSST